MMFYDRQGKPVSAAAWEAAIWPIDKRRVALTELGDWRVSTVLLGIDYSFGMGGPPLIFETMIFEGGSASDLYVDRYATEDAALAGHDRAVAFLKHRLAEVDEIASDGVTSKRENDGSV